VISAVLATGSELVSGMVVDTNSSFLAGRLYDRSAPVSYAVQVPDDREIMSNMLRLLADKADLLFVTGGLGPTADDFTTEIVARTFGLEVTEDPEAWRKLQERFKSFGVPISDNNRKQASVPQGAVVLDNPRGTACGYRLQLDNCWVVVMPGVPREMKPMFDETVLPWLAEDLGLVERGRRRILKTIGIPESKLDRMLSGFDVEGVELGFRYHFPENHITLKAAELDDPEAELDHAEALVRSLLGSAVFAVGDETIEQVVGKLLTERGSVLALAESCTGGLIAKLLTDVPGSSAFLDSGYVAYANRAKTELLGVPAELIEQHGAVSAEVATALAEGAQSRRDVDVAVGVTGIAGPDGGSAEKPVGTVFVGLALRGGESTVRRFRLWGDRNQVRQAASSAALNMIRQALLQDRAREE
jgi:competence/damage-inducible protein CinA-like protein